MSPVSPFADLMINIVQLRRRTGVDEYGEPTYGSAESLQCRVVGQERFTRAVGGQEVVSTTTVYVLGDHGIKSIDKITLPDGEEPPVLATRTFPDEFGIHHQEVLL